MPIYPKLLLLTLFFLGFAFHSKKHPLHLSTTEINFNAREKSLEVTCRIFTDDFERVLTKSYQKKVDLSKPSMSKAMDELIKKYMAANLKYQVNGKFTTANYVGFEKDHEATNVYLEIENVAFLQKLNLSNTIMYDVFDDQMGILHVEKAGVRKSTRTSYPDAALSVVF